MSIEKYVCIGAAQKISPSQPKAGNSFFILPIKSSYNYKSVMGFAGLVKNIANRSETAGPAEPSAVGANCSPDTHTYR